MLKNNRNINGTAQLLLSQRCDASILPVVGRQVFGTKNMRGLSACIGRLNPEY